MAGRLFPLPRLLGAAAGNCPDINWRWRSPAVPGGRAALSRGHPSYPPEIALLWLRGKAASKSVRAGMGPERRWYFRRWSVQALERTYERYFRRKARYRG